MSSAVVVCIAIMLQWTVTRSRLLLTRRGLASPASPSPAPASSVGFIGLGLMGGNMAKNLIAKYPGLLVYDIVEANLLPVEEKGAKRCSSVAELAGQCSTIITMLPATQHVASVLRGPGGVYANAKPGTLVIDCSTIDPVVSRELSAEAEQTGHRMIDAPVAPLAPPSR